MSVPGVANVAIWGQRDKQFQVLVDPQRLRAAGVTLDAVTRAAGDAAVISAGGFVDTPNLRLSVTQLGLITTPEDLARTVVEFRNGTPIRLGDVAEVRIGHPAPIGDGVINDGPGILLIVEKQPWGNTLEVTAGVEKILAELKPGLPGVEMDSTIFRPATFIQLSLDHLTEALWLGCLLVVIILWFFLADWRTTVISLTAIPLSLAIALLLLRRVRGHRDELGRLEGALGRARVLGRVAAAQPLELLEELEVDLLDLVEEGALLLARQLLPEVEDVLLPGFESLRDEDLIAFVVDLEHGCLHPSGRGASVPGS